MSAALRGGESELSLELGYFLGAVAERHRQLSRHAAVRAGADDQDRASGLDHCAGDRNDRRRDAHAAVEDGVGDRLLLRRVLSQYSAAGAAVPVVLRAAGIAAAHRRIVAEADAQRAVLDGG